jgi:hypothetical protein
VSDIQRSVHAGPLSAADAAIRLRNAPAWVVERVNTARQLRGLAPVPVRKPAAPPVRRKPAPAKSAPAAKLPAAPTRRAPVAAKPAAPAAVPPIVLIPFAGEGNVRGVRERFAGGAFDGWFARLRADRSSAPFVIRVGGHDGPQVASLADGSISIRLHREVGPVIVWNPNVRNVRHAAVVEMIRAGLDSVSAEFHHPQSQLSMGFHHIAEAVPCGAAILRHGERPCFPGALAGIIDPAKPIELEIARMVRKSLARAAGKP